MGNLSHSAPNSHSVTFSRISNSVIHSKSLPTLGTEHKIKEVPPYTYTPYTVAADSVSGSSVAEYLNARKGLMGTINLTDCFDFPSLFSYHISL